MKELKKGNETTEYSLAKYLMIAGVILAVAASLGKVPFTPDQLSAYLANVIGEASEWSKVLMPYVVGIWGFYAWLRNSLKKKQMELETKEVETKRELE